MKYIIYARKSSEGVDRQIQSIDDQINYLTKLAKDKGLDIVKVFSESKSAKKPGRPVFDEMIEFIQDGKADGILTWKIDRLYRNPSDFGLVQWLLQESIIKEILTSDGPHLPDDNALLLAIESSMANQYVRDLSKNVKRGINSKLEKGVWPNYAPIGYLNKDGGIIVDKPKSKYIKKAFELYSHGDISLKDLAEKLYKDGFKTKAGNKHHKSRLHVMLSNTFYYGVMYMHGEYYLGTHKPLISKELFDRTQDVLFKKHHKKRRTHFFTYRGKLTCEKCGCALTASKKKGHSYYYCTNGKGDCEQHKKYLREESVEELLTESFNCLTFDEELVEIMYSADKELLQKDEDYKQNILNTLSKELNLIATKRKKLLDGYCSDVIPSDAYKAKDKEFQKEEVDKKAQIKKIKTSIVKESTTLEQQKKYFLTACTLQKTFSNAKKDAKSKTLQDVLWNATIINQEIACLSLNQPYQTLAEIDDLNDIVQLR